MLIGGILAFVFREKVELTMRQEMKTSLKFYGSSGSGPISRAWDQTQERLRCCGVESYWDWLGQLPESCCVETYNGLKKPCRGTNSRENVYQKGCFEEVQRYVQKNAAIIGGAGVLVALLMILGMVFSCMLFKMIK